jgi:hypothetical protein
VPLALRGTRSAAARAVPRLHSCSLMLRTSLAWTANLVPFSRVRTTHWSFGRAPG